MRSVIASEILRSVETQTRRRIKTSLKFVSTLLTILTILCFVFLRLVDFQAFLNSTPVIAHQSSHFINIVPSEGVSSANKLTQTLSRTSGKSLVYRRDVVANLHSLPLLQVTLKTLQKIVVNASFSSNPCPSNVSKAFSRSRKTHNMIFD